jgi:hypothetical protein
MTFLPYSQDNEGALGRSFKNMQKLVAAISALAMPVLAHAQQGGPQPTVPKPTKADAQKVVQIITSDKVKTQTYCDLTKLEGQVKALPQNTDTKTVETLTKQAEVLIDKLGPEYFKLMDGLEKVDPKSSEAKEFMSILSELDKRCTK